MTYAIIKDAPLLPVKRGRDFLYPFPEMEIGDAFDIPRNGAMGNGQDRTANKLSACARGYAKRNSPTAKFTVRLLDENTVRCWRVA